MPPIDGTPGPDTLTGTDGNDIINGLGGDDTIYAQLGDDIVDGGDGNDVIFDTGGSNILHGGLGDDQFRIIASSSTLTTAETSQIFGDAGNDLIILSARAFGGTVRRLGDGGVTVAYGLHTDVIHGVETLLFGDFLNIQFRLDREAGHDWNADNFSDIATFGTSNGEIQFSLNTGLSSYMPSFEPSAANGPGPWTLRASGDINSDGIVDFIARNEQTGINYGFYSRGGQASPVGGEIATPANMSVALIADIDGDLRDNIVWQNSSNGQILVQGGVTDLLLPAIGAEWKLVGAEDFDRDGDADLLLRRSTDGLIYIWKTENLALSGGVNLGAFGVDWTVNNTGDFNHDGFGDIALKNTVTGQFYLLLMNNSGSYAGSNLGTIGTAWNIATVGDYNGDGTDDIIWRNTTTNQIYLWTMQDGHQLGSSPYGYLAADQIII